MSAPIFPEARTLSVSAQRTDNLLADLITVSDRFDDLEVLIFPAFLYTTFSANEHTIEIASTHSSCQAESHLSFIIIGTTFQNVIKNHSS